MSEIIPESKIKHRRRRPAVSCTLCRKRKIRCNRDSPCSNCVRSRNQTCVYDASVQVPASHSPVSPSQLTVPPFQGGRSRSNSNLHSEQSPASTGRVNALPFSSSSSPPSTRDAELESLRNQVRQLESQLQHQARTDQGKGEPLNQSIETTTSELAGTFHVQHETRPNDQPSRARLVHKTRVFGQSHWSNGIIQFRDIFHAIDPVLRQRSSQATADINRCKSLANFIKTQRLPPWPTPLSSNSIPERGLADRLVHCYFETIETVYRILHIPTFQKEYEGIWRSEYNNDLEQDRAIQIQLKLVLAIGAVSYDDSFSLRASALQWIYEAQAWASEPDLKLQINLRYVQNNILLLLARELVGVGGDLLWVSAGSLIRTAMYMGLHRDPARLPNRSFLDSEMHKRLWNTILEVSLSASMSSGGPVLISLSDFETPTPGNFDDEQLAMPTINNGGQGNHQQRPLPRPDGEWTETSVAIAFRQTFPLRLAIAKILNDLSSTGTYQETLELDAELRATYKVLCQTLQRCQESSDGSSNKGRRGPSRFASNWVDFQMHRFLSALHGPFFGPALKETAYAFSRKVVVETSLKIWRVVDPVPSSSPGPQITMVNNRVDRQAEHLSNQEDGGLLARLAICGSGYIRTVPLLAAAAIAAELRTQLREESTSLGPVPVRPDLLAVVHGVRAWRLKCLSAGEINVKAFMLASLVAAQIDGLIQGLGRESLTMFLVNAAEKAAAEALGVFEETAGRFLHSGSYSTGPSTGMGIAAGGSNGVDPGAAVGALYLDGMSLGGVGDGNSSAGTSVDFMEGWDFMYQVPETMFGGGPVVGDGGIATMGPNMGWIFSQSEA